MLDPTRVHLEHCRVYTDSGRVVFASTDSDGVEALPFKNIPFLLLGAGTSITQEAARMLAAERVPFGFCGGHGTPLFTTEDIVWQIPGDDYGPSEYMQQWARIWFDASRQLEAGKLFLRRRAEFATVIWGYNEFANPGRVYNDDFAQQVDSCTSLAELTAFESGLNKAVFTEFARIKKLNDFVRQTGIEKARSDNERINALLDSSNHLAHGLAAGALAALGISHAFPILNGRTRRGGLVNDVADLITDGIMVPLSFNLGKKATSRRQSREKICALSQEHDAITFMIDTIKQAIALS